MNTHEKKKILIVEDETINLNMLTSILKNEYTLILEKRGARAVERAEQQLPDLILLDIMIPDLDGYSIISALKSNDRTKEIPVIFISSLSGAADEEKGFLLGAVDYITKPYNAAIIRARVKTHIMLVTQRQLLERIAMLDGLTEIANRRSFTERFSQEWERATRDGIALSLMILDVDAFKEYNDHYGHGMGDVALKALAFTFTEALNRPADFVARIGGEEFAILLPGTPATGGYALAESIRKAVESLNLPHVMSSISPFLTVSIGGATLVPTVMDGQKALFEIADQMMYHAKKQGKNNVQWHRLNEEITLFSTFPETS